MKEGLAGLSIFKLPVLPEAATAPNFKLLLPKAAMRFNMNYEVKNRHEPQVETTHLVRDRRQGKLNITQAFKAEVSKLNPNWRPFDVSR